MGWLRRPKTRSRRRTGTIRRRPNSGAGAAKAWHSLRHGSFGGGQTDAMAVLDASGTITMRHNAPDLGQGIFNLISVLPARALDIPQEQVTVALPDTALRLAFMGVNSQRTTIQLGTAVYNACEFEAGNDPDSCAAERRESGRVDRGAGARLPSRAQLFVR